MGDLQFQKTKVGKYCEDLFELRPPHARLVAGLIKAMQAGI